MVKTGPNAQPQQLLKIWKEETVFLPFQEIVEEAKKEPYNLQKRTVINYLNFLVKKEVLEKHADTDRKTYYKPVNRVDVLKETLKGQIESEKAGSFERLFAELGRAWKRDREKPEEIVRSEEEDYRKKQDAISKPGSARDNWVKAETMQKILEIESKMGVIGDSEFVVTGGLEFFLYNQFTKNAEEAFENPWNVLDTSEKLKKAFIDILVSHLIHDIAFDSDMIHDSSKEERANATKDFLKKLRSKELWAQVEAEATKILDDMLKDGTVEIKPVYLFKFKDKQKALETLARAHMGYP
jgi:predicted transcriptional regulator